MLKIVGSSIYAHCSNFDEWKSKCVEYMDEDMFDELYQEAYIYYSDMVAEEHFVMKFDKTAESISLISSPDWDIRHEPSVGDGIYAKYDAYGNVSYRVVKARGQIYHNKWMFVQPDYNGFNINAEKLRTVQWNRIPGIKAVKGKIGYRKFWNTILKENGLSL